MQFVSCAHHHKLRGKSYARQRLPPCCVRALSSSMIVTSRIRYGYCDVSIDMYLYNFERTFETSLQFSCCTEDHTREDIECINKGQILPKTMMCVEMFHISFQVTGGWQMSGCKLGPMDCGLWTVDCGLQGFLFSSTDFVHVRDWRIHTHCQMVGIRTVRYLAVHQ